MKILIQGAGIAGLTLARESQQRGMDFLIVEKAPLLKPLGAGITLASNALKCLQHTMNIADLRKRGQSLELMYLTDNVGEVLSTLPTCLPNDSMHGMAIHRQQLHEALLEGLDRNKILLGVSVQEFSSLPDKVHATLTNGTVVEADYLVGADGIKSEIRRYIDSKAPIVFSGYTCWRAVVQHQLANPKESVEAWGAGKRLGYIQISPDQLYIYITLNASQEQFRNGKTNRNNEELKDLFQEFKGESAEVIRKLCASENLIHNDLVELLWKRWTKDRVVLIGDAAHAMTPDLGQGAAMGIEDAYALAELWAKRCCTILPDTF